MRSPLPLLNTSRLLFALAMLGGSDFGECQEPRCQWIWAARSSSRSGEVVTFRLPFQASDEVSQARWWCVSDFCHATTFLNGQQVVEQAPYGEPVSIDVTSHLRSGENVLRVHCRAVDGPSAIAARLELIHPQGEVQRHVTGADWQVATVNRAPADSRSPSEPWDPASEYGRLEEYPWGIPAEAIAIGRKDNYEQWRRALESKSGTSPSALQVQEGFEVRLLRSATESEDSWVALTEDRRGRWIVAREKKGLLRFTLDANHGRVLESEVINETLLECRGLVTRGDDLYAMANASRALFRLRDSTDDGQFDQVEQLAEFPGDLGHGRNQITLGPDGLIYAIFGDAVYEPESASSLVPALLAPNRFEGARSGFVARSPEGRQWEVVVRGLRNPFGIDFNAHGEMFTYDADAEYDMGASWYRPTRIKHLMLGGDYGWRRVTTLWPPYFHDRPDMPQPTLDVGKGSPTAVAFGHRSSFPTPWRDALFALDWAYGRILAVHLRPRGSSYAAAAETFLRGQPLNVTALKFGQDGAMYFVTGGRGTQSAFYRVAATGGRQRDPATTAQQRARNLHAKKTRETRRRLQSLLGENSALSTDQLWPFLNAPDPWIRHAARTALEWQPTSQWKRQAFETPEIDSALAALTALKRVGPTSTSASVLEYLIQIELTTLNERQKREAVFLYERCLDELASTDVALRESSIRQLDRLYPDSSFVVNRRLSRLLAEADIADFVARTMRLLGQASQENERFHYLFVLRNCRHGWTPEQRETYYDYFRQSSQHLAGQGMPRFRQLIRNELLETLAANDRQRVADLLDLSFTERWSKEFGETKREFVRAWRVADFEDSLVDLRKGHHGSKGADLYRQARCIACHRRGDSGGVVGPDLTAIASRFSPRDLLESIIEPSRVVAENYRTETLVLKDGRVITGTVVANDYRSESLQVVTNSLAPEQLTVVAKDEIEAHRQADTSPMPRGLLDTLSKEEVLDLIGWLTSSSEQ